MVKAVQTLTERITGGDQVVVFFAGHGVQIKTGNHLLPVDIEASSEGEIEKTAYALADLTNKLSEALLRADYGAGARRHSQRRPRHRTLESGGAKGKRRRQQVKTSPATATEGKTGRFRVFLHGKSAGNPYVASGNSYFIRSTDTMAAVHF